MQDGLERAGHIPGALDALLCAFPGDDGVEPQDGGRQGDLEGWLEAGPSIGRGGWNKGVQVRERRQGVCEGVLGLGVGVALDAHEDGEAVEEGQERLIGGAVRIVGGDEALDGLAAIAEELGEQGADVLGLVRAGEVPVREFGHVVHGDGEHVEQALRAPVREVLAQVREGRWLVQAEDRVGHFELALGGR